MRKQLWVLGALFVATAFSEEPSTEAEKIAIEAYIYGYPLITMDQTRQVMTNVAQPEGTKAPMGQFANLREYPTTAFKDVTAPNADTLYSVAWLDLAKEPYLLHVPNEEGRYYLMPLLSGWTDVIGAPGTRTTGTKAGDFAITGPSWKGALPAGVKEIKSPTEMVWIIGRTYCTGTKEDYEAVHKIQDQYALIPLSSFGKPYTPPQGIVNPKIEMKTAVRDQVNSLSAAEYFSRLAHLMKSNPPAAEDAAIVAKMAKIGIIPGQEFSIDPKIASALEKAPKAALAKISVYAPSAGKRINGWLFSTKTGRYGTDYLQRAFITLVGLGANLPQDAIYPSTHVDSEGKPLSGANKYLIRFPKGQTPPVNGFWSLTMYDDKFFFVANPLNRYTLSARNPLKADPDGSVPLYIQHESPGQEKEANWLPAPADKFVLMLRFYWPKEAILDGTWSPPAVERVK